MKYSVCRIVDGMYDWLFDFGSYENALNYINVQKKIHPKWQYKVFEK